MLTQFYFLMTSEKGGFLLFEAVL